MGSEGPHRRIRHRVITAEEEGLQTPRQQAGHRALDPPSISAVLPERKIPLVAHRARSSQVSALLAGEITGATPQCGANRPRPERCSAKV